MRLQDRTALVTGGAGGIGQAIALRLAQEGADVVIAVHRHDAKADEIADAVRAAGRRAFVVAADIGNVAQAGALIDRKSVV